MLLSIILSILALSNISAAPLSESLPPTQSCAAYLDGQTSSADQYLLLLQRAIEKSAVSADAIERLLTSTSPANPFADEYGASGQAAETLAFRLGFEKILKSGELDWNVIKAKLDSIIQSKNQQQHERTEANLKTAPVFAPIVSKDTELSGTLDVPDDTVLWRSNRGVFEQHTLFSFGPYSTSTPFTMAVNFRTGKRVGVGYPQQGSEPQRIFKKPNGELVTGIVEKNVYRLVNVETGERKNLLTLNSIPAYKRWLREIEKDNPDKPRYSYHLIQRASGKFAVVVASKSRPEHAIRIDAATKRVTPLKLVKHKQATVEYWESGSAVFAATIETESGQNTLKVIDTSVRSGKVLYETKIEEPPSGTPMHIPGMGPMPRPPATHVMKFSQVGDRLFVAVRIGMKHYLCDVFAGTIKFLGLNDYNPGLSKDSGTSYFNSPIPVEINGRPEAIIGARYNTREVLLVSLDGTFEIRGLKIIGAAEPILNSIEWTNAVIARQQRTTFLIKQNSGNPDDTSPSYVIDLVAGEARPVPLPKEMTTYYGNYVDNDSIITVWGPDTAGGTTLIHAQIFGPMPEEQR